MKITRLFTILSLFLCVTQGCKEASAKTSTNVQSKNEIREYQETDFKLSSDYASTAPHVNIKIKNAEFRIRFVEDRSYLQPYVHNEMVSDWQSVIYNFTYDSSFETAEKQIKVLSNDDEGYLLLPGYTEELETYSVYYFSPQTFEYKQTIALPELLNSPYKMTAEKETNLKFYAETKEGKRIAFIPQDQTVIDRHVIEQDLQKLRGKNTEVSPIDKNVDPRAVIQHLKADLNGDGNPDKVLVLKKNIESSDFQDQHFNLEFQVYLSQKDQPAKLFANTAIAYSDSDACVAEGFSNVVARQNYFTIEGQTCYDRSIIVNNYITFKVVNNEVWLHRYGEEYFDKADHDREIPTSSWTEKDFGKIKMAEVSENFLFKLREKR